MYEIIFEKVVWIEYKIAHFGVGETGKGWP